jgi:hypothetical protein
MTKAAPSISTDSLFYESINDAAKVVVLALGGPKEVGPRLWGTALKSAPQRVHDCLNPNREEKFSPEEIVQLARWGREVGCHALAICFNAEAGYAPPVPLAPEDERVEHERKVIEAVGMLKGLIERSERLYGKRG